MFTDWEWNVDICAPNGPFEMVLYKINTHLFNWESSRDCTLYNVQLKACILYIVYNFHWKFPLTNVRLALFICPPVVTFTLNLLVLKLALSFLPKSWSCSIRSSVPQVESRDITQCASRKRDLPSIVCSIVPPKCPNCVSCWQYYNTIYNSACDTM